MADDVSADDDGAPPVPIARSSGSTSGSANGRAADAQPAEPLPWTWPSDAWDAPDKMLRARREFERRARRRGAPPSSAR